MTAETAVYDPFAPGPFAAASCTVEARDPSRDRVFPCEIWYPEGVSGPCPLIAFSHSSGGSRKQSSFLCTHLAKRGYVVAALDHSERVAPELARKEGETEEAKASRQRGWISNRVPDIRFLLDFMLRDSAAVLGFGIDADRVGLAGHSFGGWTVLAATEADPRVRAVAAMAPAGHSKPKPGVLKADLGFHWQRDVPALYLAAEDDVSIQLSGIEELFERTPGTKRMFVLKRADHLHFMDEVEVLHEAVRGMSFPGELSWLPLEMRPISELCTAAEAHTFVRSLTLAHFDASLQDRAEARDFLDAKAETDLARHGVSAFRYL